MNEQTFAEQIAFVQYQAREREKVLLELLRGVEWIPDVNVRKKYDWCPVCEQLRGQGHADDCDLAKELRD